MEKEPETEQKHTQQFDIIVIGGGIIGCGIAREARLRGISVALFEKGDFASGTSGRTSSLVHGGIRYLSQGAFGLVRESCEERHTLLRLAPHLVSPLPFLFPIYEGRSKSKLSVQIGMALYHYLAKDKAIGPHRFLSPAQVRFMEPNLSPQGLKGAALFSDCQMDDARLCLSVLHSAKKLGAKVFNYTEVISLIKHGRKVCGVRVKDIAGGNEYDVEGGVIVNASGAWSDTVCQMEGVTSKKKHVKPTKGIHLVLPKITEKHAVVLSGNEKGRIFFVMPWREHSLIGTTDTHYQGDPNHVVPDEDEVKSLLSETAAFFPVVAQEKVLARFAALRPLSYSGKKNPLSISRKEQIEWTAGKMLVISGGKFTLFRKIAERVIDEIRRAYPRLPALKRPQTEPLLHGAPAMPINRYLQKESTQAQQITKELLGYLMRAYGTNYEAVVECAKGDPRLLKPITALGHPILAEVIYAVRHEQAVHLSDFMLRRTRIAYGPYRNSLRLIQTIAKTMGAELGWNAEQMLNELQAYIAEAAQ
jgi:glycerol-3-phosphate dehydrogenase